MSSCKKNLATVLAGLGAISYLVCHFWGLVIPVSVQPLHADLLRISVLGWSGMNFTSLFLGLVQWAIWGFLVGLVISKLIHCKKDSACGADKSCCEKK